MSAKQTRRIRTGDKRRPELREVVVSPRDSRSLSTGQKLYALRAREALAVAFSDLNGCDRERIRVERPARVGGGRSRSAWLGKLSLKDDDATAPEWVALVPRLQLHCARAKWLAATEKRALAEGRLLVGLRELGLRFVPQVHALVRGIIGGVLVMEYTAGRPVLLSLRDVDSIARLAARLHAVDDRSVRPFFEATSRRAHAEAVLDTIAKRVDGDDVIAAAHAFAAAHLPPRAPAVLIHGDLRGTNIRVDRSRTVRVVGWERARLGDSAADLATMESPTSRWFHTPGDLDALIRAYRKAGGDHAVEPEHVRIHELARLVVEYRRLMANHPTRRRAGVVRSRIAELLDLLGSGTMNRSRKRRARPRKAPIKPKPRPPAVRASVPTSSERVESPSADDIDALFDDWS